MSAERERPARRVRWAACVCAALTLGGCGGTGVTEDGGLDAATRDSAVSDAANDSAANDGGPQDGASSDAGVVASDHGADMSADGGPTTLPDGSTAPLPVDLMNNALAALPAGHAFLSSQATVEPFANFAGDLLARRFGVAGFELALERFDAGIAAAQGGAAGTMRLARRTFDYDSPLTAGDLEAVSALTDRVTMPALHCDRAAWPADYDARLASAEAEGGYGATHVALAWVWASDHGCALPLPAARWVVVVAQLVAIVEAGVATDLAFEAAALLHYVGQGFRVPDALVRATLDAQRADGGWDWQPGDPEIASNWHSTGLALWFLHERLGGPTYDTMSAAAR